MQPDTQIEIEMREVSCRRCTRQFEAEVVDILGRKIYPTICSGCAKSEKSESTAAEAGTISDHLARIGINVRSHGSSTLANLDGAPRVVDAAREFVDDVRDAGHWGRVRGLLLCGNTGVGKTHAAVAIIRELLNNGVRPDRIVFDRASRLITDIQDTYGTGGTAAVLERREHAHLWVLDDLGAEKATADSLRIIHDLIDAREGHPNVITSNLTPNEWGERFGENDGWARIASRLGARNYRILRVQGDDRRFQAPTA